MFVCGRVKGLTTSMESGEEERPSSRARETARSRTLSTCQASWEASFPSMASLISFSALSTAAVVPIALLRLGALLLSSPLLRTNGPTDDGRSAVRRFGAAAAFQSRTLQSVNCSSINTSEAQYSLRSIHPTTISAKLPPQIWNISQ